MFPEMQHTFQMAGRAPEADDAIRRLADWVRPKLGLADRTAAHAIRALQPDDAKERLDVQLGAQQTDGDRVLHARVQRS